MHEGGNYVTAVVKGINSAECNLNSMDGVVLAINSKAPTKSIKYMLAQKEKRYVAGTTAWRFRGNSYVVIKSSILHLTD